MYKPSMCSSAGHEIEEMLIIHSNLSHQRKMCWHKNFKTASETNHFTFTWYKLIHEWFCHIIHLLFWKLSRICSILSN